MKSNLSKLSCDELVQLYLQGENSAIEVLLSKVSSLILKKVYISVKDREDANDLFQDVMVHLVIKIRMGAYVKGSFLSWLHTLVSNYICSYCRKSKVYFRCEGLETLRVEVEVSTVSYEKALQDLEEMLSRLPQMSQLLIKMRYWGAMSYQEIAHRTGINQSTVVKRIRVGCKLLRAQMERLGYNGIDY